MPKKHNLLLVNEFHAGTIRKLDAGYHTHHLWKLSQAEKIELIKDLQAKCFAAATGSWACDDLVYKLDSLKLITCFGVGTDSIDFKQIIKRGTKVTNTPDVLSDSVADLALALILATNRNIVKADSFVRNKKWLDSSFPLNHQLRGKTLGIIGLGRIGEEIALRALSFKLRICYHNRSEKNVPYAYYPSIAELAENSDILLCALPGGENTASLIDEDIFRQLGPEGVFINIGRGSSVDENALIDALQCGNIAAAGLDVYANEPSVPDALIEMDNVVLLPHLGSSTIETREAMGDLVIQNLAAYFSSKPLLTEVTQ